MGAATVVIKDVLWEDADGELYRRRMRVKRADLKRYRAILKREKTIAYRVIRSKAGNRLSEILLGPAPRGDSLANIEEIVAAADKQGIK